jgi:hypothetical protein
MRCVIDCVIDYVVPRGGYVIAFVTHTTIDDDDDSSYYPRR